jgi:hypothetical protein
MSVGRALGMVVVFSAFGAAYLSVYPLGPSRVTWFVVFAVLLVVGGLLIYFSKHRPTTEPPMPERSAGQYGPDGFAKTAPFTAAGGAAADSASDSGGGDGGGK